MNDAEAYQKLYGDLVKVVPFYQERYQWWFDIKKARLEVDEVPA